MGGLLHEDWQKGDAVCVLGVTDEETMQNNIRTRKEQKFWSKNASSYDQSIIGKFMKSMGQGTMAGSIQDVTEFISALPNFQTCIGCAILAATTASTRWLCLTGTRGCGGRSATFRKSLNWQKRSSPRWVILIVSTQSVPISKPMTRYRVTRHVPTVPITFKYHKFHIILNTVR